MPTASPFTRRRLLQGLGGLGVALAAPAAIAQSAFRVFPFQLGVAAGDPQPDGFVIWTRLAPEPFEPDHGMPSSAVSVAWEVAADEGFKTIVRSGEAMARPELGHAVHVEVAGLEPARAYWYRFTAGGERSLPGRARTTPLEGAAVDRVRFAVAGCQHYEQGFYTAHRKLAGEDLDFIYCYGDYIYEGRGARVWNSPAGPVENVRQHLGGETYSLDDYRRRYAQYKMDADLQAAHASAAWFAVWDDHETDNNWVGDVAADAAPPEVFRLRRQAAAQAYYEHMPLRASAFPAGGATRLHRRAAYGRLLQLNVLDTRQYRTDQACGDRWATPCPDLGRAGAEVLGTAQEAWLLDGVSKTPATWKALAQQIMVMDLDRDPGPGQWVNLDSWAGYAQPRARLLRALAERKVANAVVLTGDEHQHYAGELHVDSRTPGPRPVAVEFVASSISSGGDGADERPDLAALQAANPQLKFNSNRRGYVVCDVTPQRWISEFKVVDRVSARDGSLSVRARLAVEAGDPRLVQA